jgi:hypothetical protein
MPRLARRRIAHFGAASVDDSDMPVSALTGNSTSHRSCAFRACDNLAMRSPQTLSEADRRLVAAWAADCAEHVLPVFEKAAPNDERPRDAIARTRAFARGELSIAKEIRDRFKSGGAARAVSPPAAAAARAAGQAAAIAHMGAHALGAAAYAAKAAGLAAPDDANATTKELRWQLRRMSPAVAAALRTLPPLGTNSSGPLGPGLLASGVLGAIIRELQAAVAYHAASATRQARRPRETRTVRSTTRLRKKR